MAESRKATRGMKGKCHMFKNEMLTGSSYNTLSSSVREREATSVHWGERKERSIVNMVVVVVRKVVVVHERDLTTGF